MKRRSGARARRLSAESSVKIEIVARSRRWKRQPRATAIVRRAIAAAARAASTPPAGLAIVLTHDSAIRALNRDWRGHDAPTNVLSFPAARPPAIVRPVGAKGEPATRKGPGSERGELQVTPIHLGDIVISYETLGREAEAEGKPFGHHLAHLAIHGYLHLIGHDHENDRDARRMERLERRILAELAIPDPYAARPARR